MGLIPRELCERYSIVPVRKIGNRLLIAIPHVRMISILIPVLETIREQTECDVEIVQASLGQIRDRMGRCHGGAGASGGGQSE